MKKRIVWMKELPEKCDHPEDALSPLLFDLLDQPYRNCYKCGTSICGRDALNYIREQQEKYPLKKGQIRLE